MKLHNVSKQRGMSLIELMIASFLGLLITIVAMEVLITANRSSLATDGVSQMQESGRFALSFLASQVRETGLNMPNSPNEIIPFVTDSCNADTCISNTDDADAGDRLAIRWSPPDGRNTDCTGAATPAGAQVANVFWVEEDNGINSLYCQGYLVNAGNALAQNSPAQAIVNGIEAMQVLYGVGRNPNTVGYDNDRRYHDVAQYVNADDVVGSEWDRIYAIRIFLLARSLDGTETDGTLSNADRSYFLADARPYERADSSISRQVFSTTIALSNVDKPDNSQ